MTSCGYVVASIGVAIVIIIVIAIISSSVSDSEKKKKLKDFMDNHKDLVDIINKRIKDTNIIGKIDDILKLLDKTIDKISGYLLNSDSKNTITDKVLTSYLNQVFINVSKSGKLKEELKNFIIDDADIHADFNIVGSKASGYFDYSDDEEYPDCDYRKIELDFKKSVLIPVNKRFKNYGLIFKNNQGDDYILIDNNYESLECYFNFDLSINLWDELKLDDIYDKIKKDLNNENLSKEDLDLIYFD